MTTDDPTNDELAADFNRATNALLLKSLNDPRSFVEVVDDYRRLEHDFEVRIGDREGDVLEMKRTLAGMLFSLANARKEPMEVCREAWSAVLRLGFSNFEAKCRKTVLYADCCAYDEQPEEGLAVLDPLLAELEQRLAEAKAMGRSTAFYECEIEGLGNLRDELEAQQRGEALPWRETRRKDEAYRPTPEEEEANALNEEFSKACRAIFKTFAREHDRSFADIVADYRRIEAEFIARVGTGEVFEEFVVDVRQKIAAHIFKAAHRLEQPFAVCRETFEELVRVDFTHIAERWSMTKMYAEICARNNEPIAGLAVVDPLMEEITRLLEGPKRGLQPPPRWTRVELMHWLEEVRKVRDTLEAQRNGGEPPSQQPAC